jgi:hypothetical protein
MHGLPILLVEERSLVGYQREMATTTPSKAWGAARVAVRALRQIIERELAAAHPLTAIYAL